MVADVAKPKFCTTLLRIPTEPDSGGRLRFRPSSEKWQLIEKCKPRMLVTAATSAAIKITFGSEFDWHRKSLRCGHVCGLQRTLEIILSLYMTGYVTVCICGRLSIHGIERFWFYFIDSIVFWSIVSGGLLARNFFQIVNFYQWCQRVLMMSASTKRKRIFSSVVESKTQWDWGLDDGFGKKSVFLHDIHRRVFL